MSRSNPEGDIGHGGCCGFAQHISEEAHEKRERGHETWRAGRVTRRLLDPLWPVRRDYAGVTCSDRNQSGSGSGAHCNHYYYNPVEPEVSP